MLNTLRFVRGAVSKKDSIPVLTHFHIYEGRIQGTNGRLTIDAPCSELSKFDLTVPAEIFLKAVDACQGEPNLTLEGEGKLRVKGGGFKALIPLGDHAIYPRGKRDSGSGTALSSDINLLTPLRALAPFIGEDASRDWACGVLFRNGIAYATNNAVLAASPACLFPMDLNLPFFLVEELIRIGREPSIIYATENSASFGYADGSWIKAQLLSAEWPDLEKLLPQFGEVLPPVPVGLALAVERVRPFCPDPKIPLIQFSVLGVGTIDGDRSACVGDYNLPLGQYRAEPLLGVLASAAEADFARYPQPVPWRGRAGVRGILVGVAMNLPPEVE